MVAGNARPTLKSATSTDKNPGIHDCGPLALIEDHEGIDVQFLQFGKIQHYLGEALQGCHDGRQVRRGGRPGSSAGCGTP